MSQAGPQIRNDQAGYTLLELLIVLAIMAVVAGVAATRLPGKKEGPRFQAAVRGIGDTLRLARSAALIEGRSIAFWIDVAQKRYGVDGGVQETIALEGASLNALSAAEEQIRASEARILFFPDGSATGGTIEIATDNRHASLKVDWLTGNVAIGP